MSRRLLSVWMLLVVASTTLVSAAWAEGYDESIRLRSFLSSAQEVDNPSREEGRSFGFARAEIFFDDDVATIEVRGLFLLRSRTDVTRFHIHRGVFGENGPIVVNFFDTVATPNRPDPDPEPIPVRRRLVRLSFELEVDPETAAEIATFPEDFYFNLHTEAFAAGEVRGQLFD